LAMRDCKPVARHVSLAGHKRKKGKEPSGKKKREKKGELEKEKNLVGGLGSPAKQAFALTVFFTIPAAFSPADNEKRGTSRGRELGEGKIRACKGRVDWEQIQMRDGPLLPRVLVLRVRGEKKREGRPKEKRGRDRGREVHPTKPLVSFLCS